MRKQYFKIFVALLLAFFVTTTTSEAGWLEGYGKRKSVTLVAADPQASYNTLNTATFTLAADNYITSYTGTTNTNNGTSENLLVQSHKGPDDAHTLITIDVSSLADYAGHIVSANLVLNYVYAGGSDPVGRTYNCYEQLHTDWSETQSTWNIYKTGSNWGSVGCGDTTTDYNTSIVASATVPASTFSNMTWNIKDHVDHALANHSGMVYLVIRDSVQGASSNYSATFCSRTHSAEIFRPSLTVKYITQSTPSVPSNYKLSLNVYKGNPTVERGSWTVNGKEYNYRVPFSLKVNDAISSVYAQEAYVNTKALCSGGFFASTNSSNAYTVEFADANGLNPMKYWVLKCYLDSIYFNTIGTRYVLGLGSGASFAANTNYTLYMYLDPDQTTQSSNYDPSGVFTFFEDFSTDAADTASFLTAYPQWSQDGGAHLSATVASGTLTLASTQADEWNGIKASSFTAQNARLWVSQAAINGTSFAGLLDTGGIITPQSGYGINMVGTTSQSVGYISGTASYYANALFGISWVTFFENYGGINKQFVGKSTGTSLDFSWPQPALDTNASTDLMPCISAYTTSNIQIRWIAVGNCLHRRPTITFPDITYETPGNLFLNNQCLNWPYDISFTGSDGLTKLNFLRDPLSQLMKEPDLSTQMTLRITDDLSNGSSIFAYYRNSTVTSDVDEMSASSTYGDTNNISEDGSSTSNFTVVNGTWATATVHEPILSKGSVGDAPRESGGALWARTPHIIPWTDGKYYMIYTNSPWEQWGVWPVPYDTYISRCDTLGDEFSVGKRVNITPQWKNPGPVAARVYDGKCYILTASDCGQRGFEMTTVTDVDDFYNTGGSQTDNPNGPFFTPTWLNTHTGTDFTNLHFFSSGTFVKDGSVYHIFLTSGYEDDDTIDAYAGQVAYFTTTDAPEDWHPDTSFTYRGKLNFGTTYFEDLDMVYDGSRYWYRVCTYGENYYHTNYAILDTNSQTFPTGTWGDWTDMDAVLPPFFYYESTRGPRLLLDGSTWYYALSGLGEDEDRIAWVPNWVALYSSSTTPADTWTPLRTASKIYMSDWTDNTYFKAYRTGSNILDGEITAEIQLDQYDADTDNKTQGGGLFFRYNSTNDTGYAAIISLEHTGATTYTEHITLYKFSGATYTQVGTQYDIPTSPTPGFYRGYPWKLRVRLYGSKIIVSYSAWGNPWIDAINTTDETYVGVAANCKVGLITLGGKVFYKNLHGGPYIETAPATGASQIQAGFKGVRTLVTPAEDNAVY